MAIGDVGARESKTPPTWTAVRPALRQRPTRSPRRRARPSREATERQLAIARELAGRRAAGSLRSPQADSTPWNRHDSMQLAAPSHGRFAWRNVRPTSTRRPWSTLTHEGFQIRGQRTLCRRSRSTKSGNWFRTVWSEGRANTRGHRRTGRTSRAWNTGMRARPPTRCGFASRLRRGSSSSTSDCTPSFGTSEPVIQTSALRTTVLECVAPPVGVEVTAVQPESTHTGPLRQIVVSDTLVIRESG